MYNLHGLCVGLGFYCIVGYLSQHEAADQWLVLPGGQSGHCNFLSDLARYQHNCSAKFQVMRERERESLSGCYLNYHIVSN